ncbi:MAG: hypothetical protein QXU18_00180 [Thermoplasmatales archaeon]
MKDIMVVYAGMGKTVRSRLDLKSEMNRRVGENMKIGDLVSA